MPESHMVLYSQWGKKYCGDHDLFLKHKFNRYMRHPNEKVARASHSVFVAFVSSGKVSEHDDRLALKEQLVFYYMQRSLEVFKARRSSPF